MPEYIVCEKCGQCMNDRTIRFCPYCGNEIRTNADSLKEEKIRRIIAEVKSAPTVFERKALLDKAATEYPDCFEIEWERLFIGDIPEKRRDTNFFSIKCYLLNLYLEPKLYSAKKAQEIREKLFDLERIDRCAMLKGEDHDLHEPYFIRLCKEFIDLFLMGSNRYTQTLFGIRIEKKAEKLMARPVAEMIMRIREDRMASEEERILLEKCFYQAFSDYFNGNTAYLDELIKTK